LSGTRGAGRERERERDTMIFYILFSRDNVKDQESWDWVPAFWFIDRERSLRPLQNCCCSAPAPPNMIQSPYSSFPAITTPQIRSLVRSHVQLDPMSQA
jgi:hypothetical protein